MIDYYVGERNTNRRQGLVRVHIENQNQVNYFESVVIVHVRSSTLRDEIKDFQVNETSSKTTLTIRVEQNTQKFLRIFTSLKMSHSNIYSFFGFNFQFSFHRQRYSA